MTVKCPQCNSQTRLLFKTRETAKRDAPEKFSYYRCQNCSLIFLSPIPSDLSQYYTSAYYKVPASISELQADLGLSQSRLDAVKLHKPKGKLLEIGAGTGGFVFSAKQAGFSVDAIEMDQACCQFMKDKLNIPAIHTDDPLEALQTLGSYDVVALWHVIEHLPDPWAFLDLVAEHINPGGILIMAAPNPASLQFRLFGKRWAHIDAPKHLQLIPIQLLIERLGKQNWVHLSTTTNDLGAKITHYIGWRWSLVSLTGWTKWMNLLGSIMYRLAAPLERTGERGSSYTIVFQR